MNKPPPSNERVPGVWLLPRNDVPAQGKGIQPTRTQDVDHLFTAAGAAPSLRDAVIGAIDAAREKVLFSSFLFSDEGVARALCGAAKRLRGGVYVITALDKHMRADIDDPDAEEDRDGKLRKDREKKHEGMLREMARAGVWLRSSGEAHAKLCVVDDRVALVTSANATREAFERNPENGLLLRIPALARELGRIFARVWLHRATAESTPGAELNVQSRRPDTAPSWTPFLSTGDVRAVATLGADERSILKETLEVIDSADKELWMSSFVLVALESHAVGEALRKALRKGVRMTLTLCPSHREDQRAMLQWLYASARPRAPRVVGLKYAHAKAIVADRRRALVWTGNLDGRHGYESGFEVGVATEREAIVAAIQAYLEDLALRATHAAVLNPDAEDLRRAGIEPPSRSSNSSSEGTSKGRPPKR